MRHRLLFILLLLTLLPGAALALTVAQRTAGWILLQVQSHGEAWYVDPVRLSRTYMADGAAAYQIMRGFGLGITDTDLSSIPVATTVDQIQKAPSLCSSRALARRLSGRILLQVQQHGEAWYVYPKNCYRIYLANGPAAYSVMRFLSLGITNADLALVPVAGIPIPPTSNDHWSYNAEQVHTTLGDFEADVVRMDRTAFEMIVDVAELSVTPDLIDCEGPCARWPLAEYVDRNNGLIGIHGTYFCPPDYAPCIDHPGEFLEPLVDTDTHRVINAHKMEFHFGPMLVQDTSENLYFYHRTKQFGSIAQFESSTGKSLRSAISNYPSLVENGQLVVDSEPLDTNQQTIHGSRGGIGYNNETIFLVIAHQATVIEFASIMQSLGATYALNLDGGASSALYVDHEYKVGPGRELPNALVFRPL